MDLQDLPEKVKECEKSILDDNPDMDRSTAIAICRDMNQKGELSDGCPTVDLSDCPEGHAQINGECVEIESIEDVPPSSLDMSAPRILSHRKLAGAIERVDQSDGSVRYTDIKLLSEGVWTDQNSKQPTHYAPENLSVAKDNTVNISHDDDNEVSAVGQIDASSAYVEDGDLFADIVLHMDSPASEYADENLQQTLETGGKKGFGGPSVEIPPEGLEISERGELGYPKTENGVIDGLGLVQQPASKPTSFDMQTANRQVALGSGQTDKALLLQKRHMADVDQIRDALEDNGIDTGEMTDDELMDFAEELHTDLMDSLEAADDEDDEDEEEAEMADDEDEDEDEEDHEMMDEGAIDVLEEQIDDLWSAIDEMEAQMSSMASQEDMSEELADAKEELAAADTVQELQEAKDELDRRLSEIEDEEKESRTLAEGMDDTEGFDWSDPQAHSAQHDSTTGSTY